MRGVPFANREEVCQLYTIDSQTGYLRILLDEEKTPIKDLYTIISDFETSNNESKLKNPFLLYCYGKRFLNPNFENRSPTKRWDYYTLAVQKGCTEALVAQGVIYLSGIDDQGLVIGKNQEIAVQLVSYAAQMGDPSAFKVLETMNQ